MARPTAPLQAGPVEQFFQWSLLGLLTSGFGALVGSGYLDLPTSILTAAGLMLRVFLVASNRRIDLAPSWVAALTIGYTGFYPLDYLFLSLEFIPATVHLICFLAILRVLTARTNRDYFFVKIIAFLELLAATLLSTSVNFFFFLSLFLVFGVATFCCTEIRRSVQKGARVVNAPRRFHWRLAALTGSVTLSIVVMTGGLFFILPRTARAALKSFVSEKYHLPGFSNEVTLGQIGELQQKTTPMLHVRIEGPNEKMAVKWRGAALGQFDGKRWYNPESYSEPVRVEKGTALLASADQRRRRGARLSYEVRIDTLGSDALFFPGIPEFVQIGLPIVLRSSGESYRTGLGNSDGAHYYGSSFLPDVRFDRTYRSEPLPIYLQNEYLSLPPMDYRIHELAQQAAQGSTPFERARALEHYLQKNYSYTSELLKDPVRDPLAHFLFERKKGHCEYFASSMAVMLRSIRIPARIITGFQSGIYNPMTRWHVIRASDAHSWVEGYIPQRGWTVFDPTPPDQRGQTPGIYWSQVALYLDAVNMFWQQWVLQYNLDQQLDLAARLQQPSGLLSSTNWFDRLRRRNRAVMADAKHAIRNYAGPAIAAICFIVAAFLFGPKLWRMWLARRRAERIRRGEVGASDAAILYARMLEILRRRGIEKPAWLTPAEFARILPIGPESPMIEQMTIAYNELRFGGRPEAASRMVDLLRELEAAS